MRRYLFVRLLRALAPALLVVACATGDSTERLSPPVVKDLLTAEEAIYRGAEAETTPDGLVRVRTPEGRAYIKPPRPHLQRYEKMMLGNLAISYKEGTAGWGRNQELKLRESLRDDMRDELLRREMWELTDEPGENVLLIRVSVLETEIDPTLGANATSSTSYISSAGGAVLALDVLTSTGPKGPEPLVWLLQRRALRSGVYSGGNIDYGRLRHSFNLFAKSVAESLHDIYERQRLIEEMEREAARKN